MAILSWAQCWLGGRQLSQVLQPDDDLFCVQRSAGVAYTSTNHPTLLPECEQLFFCSAIMAAANNVRSYLRIVLYVVLETNGNQARRQLSLGLPRFGQCLCPSAACLASWTAEGSLSATIDMKFLVLERPCIVPSVHALAPAHFEPQGLEERLLVCLHG